MYGTSSAFVRSIENPLTLFKKKSFPSNPWFEITQKPIWNEYWDISYLKTDVWALFLKNNTILMFFNRSEDSSNQFLYKLLVKHCSLCASKFKVNSEFKSDNIVHQCRFIIVFSLFTVCIVKYCMASCSHVSIFVLFFCYPLLLVNGKPLFHMFINHKQFWRRVI